MKDRKKLYEDIYPVLHEYRTVTVGREQNHQGRWRDKTVGVEYARTKEGLIPQSEWYEKAEKAVTESGDKDLLDAIIEHVKENCAWLKDGQHKGYALECLIRGSYEAWNDKKIIAIAERT